jgi:hypothetical protein
MRVEILPLTLVLRNVEPSVLSYTCFRAFKIIFLSLSFTMVLSPSECGNFLDFAL